MSQLLKFANAITDVGFPVEDFNSEYGDYGWHCPFCWNISKKGHTQECLVNEANKLIEEANENSTGL